MIAVTLLLVAPLCMAPPELTAVFPPAVQAGQEATLTLSGTFPKWPVEVPLDSPAFTATADSEKGKVKLQVAAGAAPGLHWLRVSGGGVSVPKPIFVEAGPVVLEQEPNDAPKTAGRLAADGVACGKLGKAGDVDVFAVPVEAGKWLVAELTANNFLDSPMDAVLQLCTEQGFVLAQNHDGRGLDPLLAWQADRTGVAYLRLFAFPSTPNSSIAFAGGETFAYRLATTSGPFAAGALPLAAPLGGEQRLTPLGWNCDQIAPESLPLVKAPTTPGLFWHTPAPPLRGLLPLAAFAGTIVAESPALTADRTPLTLPCSITGVIAQPQERDRYYFRAAKGDKLALVAESASLGFDCDLALRVLAENDTVAAENDDLGKNRDPSLTFTAPAEGLYAAELRDLTGGGGPRRFYRLAIEPLRPQLELTVAAPAFNVKSSEPLEVLVTIGRKQGFTAAVEIVADNLPAGFTAEPVVSESKGDSAKSVKLKLSAQAAAQTGPFRIVAREAGQTAALAVAVWNQPLAGATLPHTELWVSLTE